MTLAEFGVRKPVPANLLMLALLLGGLVCGLTLRREFFPQMDPDQAMVTLIYPGASPEEVEDALAVKVEQRLTDVEDVDEIQTTISEGGGGIMVKFREGVNVQEALDDVRQAMDSVTDLPAEAEPIQVRLLEPRLPVIRVPIFGDLEEEVIKRAVRGIEDDLRTLPGMGEIIIDGTRPYEISVDVSREAILDLGISVPEVASAVGLWLREVPGGTVRTSTGNIKIRTMGVPERAAAIRDIVVRSDVEGRTIRVRDIATVREGFTEDQIINRFNGRPAAILTVYAVGNQDIVRMAEMVRSYAAGRRGEPLNLSWMQRLLKSHRVEAWRLGSNSMHPLPVGASIGTTSDLARFVEGRLDLLLRNAQMGAVLVFLTLLTFLNWRAAFWVGIGLLTAVGGTLLLMWSLDITLNLLTMFGLIVVLGLLVDDAIVVAENIQTEHDGGKPAFAAAIDGTRRVLWPVVATVSTTIVAFLPLTFIRGQIGDLLGALPMVVACALAMSLLEATSILPSHMAHTLRKREKARPSRLANAVKRAEGFRDHILHDRIIPRYAQALDACLQFRYITIGAAVAILLLSLGLVLSGRVVFTFLSDTDAETIVTEIRMPIGAPIERTNQMVMLIEEAARAQPETLTVAAQIGQTTNIETSESTAAAAHVAQMFIELVPVEERDRESSQVIAAIRHELAGRMDEAERITFEEISGGPAGADITIRVQGTDREMLRAAANDVKELLREFEGVHDITDDEDRGQMEMRVHVLPSGAALNFNTVNIAQQIRGALYGIEAYTFAADREDIDVRVRLDAPTRESLFAIENLWLVSPQGTPVPLSEVARIEESSTYATIRRVDRQPAITVTADTAPGLSPEDVVGRMTSPSDDAGADGATPLDEIRQRYPMVRIEFAGRQEQMGDAFASLPYGFAAAIIMIYVILAWLFSSYIQPLIVLMAVPFSIVGVVFGHLLLGYDITFLSLIGFVALSGIVVNDSLILVEFFNEMRHKGMEVREALVAAGRARFRAIMLTTLTTVLGLTPLILERSFQAKFMIPMAISIAIGLLSATVLILVVLPCFMLAFHDLRKGAYFLWHGQAHTLPPMSKVVDIDHA